MSYFGRIALRSTDGTKTVDVLSLGELKTYSPREADFLQSIDITLKKIEYHLSIATDTNLNDQDVGG